MASPDCPIITERFQFTNGTTSNTSANGWTLNSSGLTSPVFFAVKSNRLHAEELGGIGIWTSNVFTITGYSDFQVAVKISSEGDMNSTEYVKVYYRVNGGAEILLDQRFGNFGTLDLISPSLVGNTVQLIARIYNYNNGGTQPSKYYIEEYRVFKETGPCSSASTIAVTATSNRTTLTCTNPSATLTAGSTAAGVSYVWSGPNGFTSTSVNPVVTVAGTYTVTGTNASGSGTASVTIADNKALPVVTTSGAVLGCASSVTIGASTPVATAQYAWTGPGGFTSSQQNPVVTTAGSYTVVVTNTATGCVSAPQTAVVSTSASNTPTTFWLEDFTSLANGTTVDTGSTPWSISNAGAGTFSVQSNEFMASFTAANEGVWQSGVIDISNRSNVIISIDLKSGVATSSDALEADDYMNVYYKLNGGAEVLIHSDGAGLNGVNNGTSTLSVTSPSLTGTTLQVVVRMRNSHATERYYFDNVRLTGTTSGGAFNVTATSTGTISCTTPTITLNSTASVSGASYQWTGPNNFSSSQQHVNVTAAGTYTVTATASGCTASATVTVTGNTTLPDLTATGGALSCSATTTLTATSTTSGVQYAWTGPNGFSSTVQNPTVTTPGAYTVTITHPTTSCSRSQTVQVTNSTNTVLWQEDFTGLTDGVTSRTGSTSWSTTVTAGSFAVSGNQLRITNTGTATNAQAVFTSNVIDISGKAGVKIEMNTRSVGATMNNTGVYMDYLQIYYKLNGGAEVLFSEQTGSIANNSTIPILAVSGLLSGNNIQIVVRGKATGNDEFYFIDDIKVTGSPISSSVTVAASASGSLTCSTNAVTLNATTIAGASYSWTGPEGYSSVQQNPVVNKPGLYTVTVLTNGNCAATGSVTVVENKTAPALSATGGTITCATTLSL
ncbi:MAG: hypothetical protein EBU52_10145, partial [Cytophagia bacterium]|nr:hypothetical protein [Cytophagia bacterium]